VLRHSSAAFLLLSGLVRACSMSLIASKAVITDIQTSLKASDWQAVLEKCASSLELRTGDVRLHLFRGYAYDKLLSLPQAEAAYRAALKIESDNAQALQGLAQVQWQTCSWSHAARSFASASALKSSKAAVKLSLQSAAAHFLATEYDPAQETLSTLLTSEDVSADNSVVLDVRCRIAAAAVGSLLHAAAHGMLADTPAAGGSAADSAADVAGSGARSPTEVDPLYSAAGWVCLRSHLSAPPPSCPTWALWGAAAHACIEALQGAMEDPPTVRAPPATPGLVECSTWAASVSWQQLLGAGEIAVTQAQGGQSPMASVGCVEAWPAPAVQVAALRPLLVLLLLTAGEAVAAGDDCNSEHGRMVLAACATASAAWLAAAPVEHSSSHRGLALSTLAVCHPSLPGSAAALGAAASECSVLFQAGTHFALHAGARADVQDLLLGAAERSPWMGGSQAYHAAKGLVFGVQGGVPAPRKGAPAAANSHQEHSVSMTSLVTAVGALYTPFVVVDPPSDEPEGGTGGGMAKLHARKPQSLSELQCLQAFPALLWCVHPLLIVVQGGYSSTLMNTDVLLPVTGMLSAVLQSAPRSQHAGIVSALTGAWSGGGAPVALHPPLTGARGGTTLPANSAAGHSIRECMQWASQFLAAQCSGLFGCSSGSVVATAARSSAAHVALLHAVTSAGCGAERSLGLTVTHLVPALPVSTSPAAVSAGAAAVAIDVVTSEDAARMPLWGPLAPAAAPPAAAPNALLVAMVGPNWAQQGLGPKSPEGGAVSDAVAAMAVRVLSAALHLGLESKGMHGVYMTPTARSIFKAVCVHWHTVLAPCLLAAEPPLTPLAEALCRAVSHAAQAVVSNTAPAGASAVAQQLLDLASAATGVRFAAAAVAGCLVSVCSGDCSQDELSTLQNTLLKAAVCAPAWGATYSALALVFRLKWAALQQAALLSRAEQCAAKAAQLNPGDVLAQSMACVLAASRGEHKLACSWAAAAVKSPALTDNSASWAALLLAQLARRGWSSATSSWSHSDLAHSQASTDELKLAEGHFQSASAGRPYASEVWLGLAHVYLAQGKISAAAKSGSRSLACWAGSTQAPQLGSLQAFLALDTCDSATARLALRRMRWSVQGTGGATMPALSWEAVAGVEAELSSLPDPAVFAVLAEAHLAQGLFEHAALRAEAALSLGKLLCSEQKPVPASTLLLCARAQLQCARQAVEDKRWPQVVAAVRWGQDRAEQALGTAIAPAEHVETSTAASCYKCLGDLLICASAVCPDAFGTRALKQLAAQDSSNLLQIARDGTVAGPHGLPLYLGPRAALLAPLASVARTDQWDIAEAAVAAFSAAVDAASADHAAAGDADEGTKLQLVEAWCDLGRCLFLVAQGVVAASSTVAAGENTFLTAIQRGEGGSQEGLWAQGWSHAPDLMQAANAAFRAALEADPSSVRAWNGAGVTEHTLGTAQHCLIQAAAMGGGGITLCNLGMVYLLAGQFVLARRAFSTAQHNDPSNQAMWVGVGHLSQVLASISAVADSTAGESTGGATPLRDAARVMQRALASADASPAAAHSRAAAAFVSATDLTSKAFATLPAGLAAANLAVGGDATSPNTEPAHATVGGGVLSGTPPPLAFLTMAVEEQPSKPLALAALAAVRARTAVVELQVGAQNKAVQAAAAAVRASLFAVARLAAVARGDSTTVPELLLKLGSDEAAAGTRRCLVKLLALTARCCVLHTAACFGLPVDGKLELGALIPEHTGNDFAGAIAAGCTSFVVRSSPVAVSLLCCSVVEAYLMGVQGGATPAAAAATALECLAERRDALGGLAESLPELMLKARLQIVAQGPATATATLQQATRICPDAHQPWRVALMLGHSIGQDGMVRALLPRMTQVADTSKQRALRLPPHSAVRGALLAATSLSRLIALLAHPPSSEVDGGFTPAAAPPLGSYEAVVRAVRRASAESDRLQHVHNPDEAAQQEARRLKDVVPESFLVQCSVPENWHLASLWLAAARAAAAARDETHEGHDETHGEERHDALVSILRSCCSAAAGVAAAGGRAVLASGTAAQAGHVAATEDGSQGTPVLALGDAGGRSTAARHHAVHLAGAVQREAAAIFRS